MYGYVNSFLHILRPNIPTEKIIFSTFFNGVFYFVLYFLLSYVGLPHSLRTFSKKSGA